MGVVLKTKGGQKMAYKCVVNFESGAYSEINVIVKYEQIVNSLFLKF
jgi:hypothetical protein